MGRRGGGCEGRDTEGVSGSCGACMLVVVKTDDTACCVCKR